MLTKEVSMPEEVLNFDQKENSALFNELFQLFIDHPQLSGLFQRFSTNDRSLFDELGVYRNESFQEMKFDEALAIFREKLLNNKFAFNYPMGDSARDIIKEKPQVLEIIVRTLIVEPASISLQGVAIMGMKNDILENIEEIATDETEQQQILDYFNNSLLPSNLQLFRQGNYNKIFKLEIPGLDKSWLIAVRTPRTVRERDDMGKGEPASFNSQIETQRNIYHDMEAINQDSSEKYARIPKPYFVTAFDRVMLMEFVDNAHNLDQLAKRIGHEAFKEMVPEIYQRLEKTLEFWQNGNNGQVLFRHHDLHPGNIMVELNEDNSLKDVYIIDFDFSIYKPGEERSTYRFEGILNRQRVLLSYEHDTQCLRYLRPLIEP